MSEDIAITGHCNQDLFDKPTGRLKKNSSFSITITGKKGNFFKIFFNTKTRLCRFYKQHTN